MLGREEDFLFFDTEVFKHNSMVVFKDIEGKTVRVFSSSLDGLGDLFDQGLIKEEGYQNLEDYITGKTLVGYNNYGYDDYILWAMCKGSDHELIKQWNDSIINKGSTVNMKKIQCCKTLDAMQQIDVSRPSLKKIEGNMGVSIVESKVDFDIDRKLTPQENYETFKYCEYDVEQLVRIYKLRGEYFESKKAIVKMLPEDYHDKAYKWNTTSIIGQLLKHDKRMPGRRLVDDSLLKVVPNDVKNMWLELDTTQDYKFKQKKVVIQEYGNTIEFGWGGLHGAPEGVFEARDVRLLDVASMYPNILINFNGLGEKTKDYKEILDYRLQLKHEGKKKEQAPYKLILNSTYGLLNSEYSAINQPNLAYSICMFGQTALYALVGFLDMAGCKVFNINTDGVAFIPDKKGAYKEYIKPWEEYYRLTLEEDRFDYWIQTDVNNYIAVTPDGKIKTKGGDVNNYIDFESGGRNYYFNNANTRIIQKAIVEKIVNGKTPSDTIWENRKRPELFQYVLTAGSTYKGTYDSNGERLQNVNRVFAGKDTDYEIFKKRQDGGLVKFADAPSHMFIHNGDLSDLENFENLVDLNWYNDLAQKKLKRWGR